MPKIKKSTKKFITNKLDKELESRKKKKKIIKKPEKKPIETEEQEEQEEFSDYSEDAGFINDQLEESSDAEDDSCEEDVDVEFEEDQVEDDYDPIEFKRELENLKETDVNFYNFLKENDKDLLVFTNEEPEKEEEKDSTTKNDILKLLNSIKKFHSLKSLKMLLLEFKRVANMEKELEMKLFNLIILVTLKHSPKTFDFHLGNKPTESKNWKNARHLVKMYSTNLVLLTKRLKKMTPFILKNVHDSIKYLQCFPKVAKDFQKAVISYWETGNEQVKVSSFLCIRRMVMLAPNTFDSTLKLMYAAFLNTARNTTPHSWPQIQFMINCIVEMCGLSLAMTYKHSFVSLRVIAVQLRNASIGKTINGFKYLYNWQCLHALDLWSRVLCTFCDSDLGKDSSTLFPLIYPLVQIMIGIMG
jgi:nucleolar complex protein 2